MLRSLLQRGAVTTNRVILRSICSTSMANSRFEYVKSYEHADILQKNCWIVVRIDGKGFHKFCDVHNFLKPNDERGLNLMNLAAVHVLQEFNEIVLAYGQSDEYSFIFRRDTSVYNRRRDKLISYVGSLFTSAYIFNWRTIFQDTLELKYPPVFDSRAVLYPTDQNLRDYMSWRQADVHINNLYNTSFWNLVASGLTNAEVSFKIYHLSRTNSLFYPAFRRKNDFVVHFRVIKTKFCSKNSTSTTTTYRSCSGREPH